MIGPLPLAALDDGARARLLDRGRAADPDVAAAAGTIIDDVRGRGDAALRDLALRFDGVALDALEVPRADWDAALAALEPDLRAALEAAAASIRRFHEAQRPIAIDLETAPGVRLGRRPDPLRRVGVYAPGGRAAYPSSVLMGVVPARVAGVGEVVVCSPPGADGRPSPLVLAACAIAGADQLFAVGGAGAVAALAYGTASVPRVDRVVGPGNAYVAAAKRLVAAVVGIDTPAGPSELLVVADGSADPVMVVVEMLAQAEHDPDAAVVLVATDAALADAVAAELEARAPAEPRAEIVAEALARNAALVVADSLEEALAFAEEYAPEHLLLLVDDPCDALDRVRCAATVFLGPASSVAFGDYATGANHVLPTGGLARSYSGLSTEDFVRWTTWQEVTPAAAPALAGVAATLAEAEGLLAHAAAARRAARAVVTDDGELPGPLSTTPDRIPLPRAPYRAMTRYDPRRAALPLDLSANTNLWGVCPSAQAALDAAAAPTDYPSPYAGDLRAALAAAWDVPVDAVTTGCGSDDLIDSALRAFCEPGAVVAFPSPTFPMVEAFARMNDARPRPVPVPVGVERKEAEAEGSRDEVVAALCDADVVYLCRPNNPTGAMLPRAAVLRVLERACGLVLVDEAYGEYAGESMADAARASGRGVVLRTFSKAYGLAGLRVGYAIGPEPLIRAIELSRGPYKVSAPAERAAAAAVREGGRWIDDVIARTRDSRERLAGALRGLGLRVFPSAANFLLVAPGRGGSSERWAAAVRAGLAARGIGVRAFPALPGVGDAIRVTVGPPEVMDRFLAALTDVLADPAKRPAPGAARRPNVRPEVAT